MKKYTLLCLCIATLGTAFSQTLIHDSLLPNERVMSIEQSGNTIYIGGWFTSIGKGHPYGSRIDLETALPNYTDVVPNAPVHAVKPDGAGGWYIGGDFTQVGGQARNRLARINADGTLHPWNPDANGIVYAIALEGSNVYVGGSFTSIGGQVRNRIAAIDATSGIVNTWNPDANNTVRSIVVNGNTVFAGGEFALIGSNNRNYLAALDATTGLASSWNPAPSNFVQALAIEGNELYVGGNFSFLASQSRSRIGSFDLASGTLTTWNPNANNIVYTILPVGNLVYVGGNFTSIGGATRNLIAALDETSGAATGWNVNLYFSGSVNAIGINGNTVYFGGSFNQIAGRTRNHSAAVDATTGLLTPWYPNPNHIVHTLTVGNNSVYVGGGFSSIGTRPRNYLAAFDATTGSLLPWNPSADAQVNTLAVKGNTVYVGGHFSTLGDPTDENLTVYSRVKIGAIDGTTGIPTAWIPQLTSPGPFYHVNSIAAGEDVVYVAGNFYYASGQLRLGIAALDLVTAAPTSFNANSNGEVFRVTLSGNTLYLGSARNTAATWGFTNIGGQPRNQLAAVDATTGAVTPWNPNPDSDIMSIKVADNRVFVGGAFSTVGGQLRNKLAALDATTGLATSFIADAGGPGLQRVDALSMEGTQLYVGGSFTTIGGQPRPNLASVDYNTGAVSSWNPAPASPVTSVFVNEGIANVGGAFFFITGQPRRFFARVTVPVNSPLPVKLLHFTVRPESANGVTKVACMWSTAEESNSDYYVIERSSDRRNFGAIGQVAAAGNASSVTHYQYTDAAPLQGISYYRLRQVDLDGKFTYSPIAINNINSNETVLVLYPNPIKNDSKLLISSPKKQKVDYLIIDASGREINRGFFTLLNGSNLFDLPLSGLSKGSYTLVIKNEMLSRTVQFVKNE